MKNNSLILFMIIAGFFSACSKSQSSLQSDIVEMEKSVSVASNVDTVNCDSLIVLYKNYCVLYKDDTICADYFFKAADLSVQVGKFKQAVELYGNTQRFPIYRKIARALFLQGFLSENNLQDKNAAREYYNRFVIKFPDHKMTPTIKLLLQTLNMTDEDLIRKLNGQSDSVITTN